MKTGHTRQYKHCYALMLPLSCLLHTFQVQVLGPIDTLTGGCSVYFQCVCVAVVSGDGHIVPLVVVQCPFTFALNEVGPVSKIKNIVDVSAREQLC